MFLGFDLLPDSIKDTNLTNFDTWNFSDTVIKTKTQETLICDKSRKWKFYKNWLIEGKSTQKSPETVYGRKTSYNNLG